MVDEDRPEDSLKGWEWYDSKYWKKDCKHACWYLFCSCRHGQRQHDLELYDEGLPSFWHAMNGHAQKNWFTQVTYDHFQLNVDRISAHAGEKLQTSDRLAVYRKKAHDLKLDSSSVSDVGGSN